MATTVTSQIQGVTISEAVKAPCAAVATSNVTLSGYQTINGVTFSAASENARVLLTAQTDTTENGIYDVDSSTWSRSKDFDGNRDVVKGTIILVNQGSSPGLFYEVTAADPVVIGTSSITIVQRNTATITYDRTAAEIAVGVTPDLYGYEAAPIGDATRYNGGTIGNATDDDNAIDDAILVIKQSGGAVIIPPTFSSSVAKPALGLANSQSGCLWDLRFDRANSGNEAFGSMDLYIEGRDASGNYATEFRILGKQNPAFTAVSLSDGTANGYTRTNYASSFLHKHGSVDQWQYIADPLFGGYYSWAQIYFAGGSGKYAMHCTIDSGSKPRFTIGQASLAAATGNINGATNATPIVISTVAAHNLAGNNPPVTIASVGGNTAANGDWEVTVLSGTSFELNGSVGNGAYTSGGTFSGQKNHSRAALNIPALGDGSICVEGVILSESLTVAPFVTQSKAVDVNFHARPYIVNLTGTQQVGASLGSGCAKHVIGTATLSGGTATITLSGDASFTSSTTYVVTLQTVTGGSSTVVPTASRTNGGEFVITGTGTDSVMYHAVGY